MAAKKKQSTLQRLLAHTPLQKENPTQFSIGTWKQALLETKNALNDKQLGILAAGIGFYATLAFFPTVAAVVSIVSLTLGAGELDQLINIAQKYLPSDMASLITTQLTSARDEPTGTFIAAIIAIAISLFTISGATQNLIKATNVSYDVLETRNFFKLRFVSLLVTVGGLFSAILVFLFISFNQQILINLGVPTLIANILSYIRWIILPIVIIVILAAFYRYGPNRKNPRWQWVSWGAAIATLLWLIGTAAFFIYVQYFGNFSDTYSLFAGIVLLMLWLNYTSLMILLGAEINNRLENKR